MTKKEQTERKDKVPEGKAEEVSEDSCRCKEVSQKTPVELFKIMLGDMAFWKKKKT